MKAMEKLIAGLATALEVDDEERNKEVKDAIETAIQALPDRLTNKEILSLLLHVATVYNQLDSEEKALTLLAVLGGYISHEVEGCESIAILLRKGEQPAITKKFGAYSGDGPLHEDVSLKDGSGASDITTKLMEGKQISDGEFEALKGMNIAFNDEMKADLRKALQDQFYDPNDVPCLTMRVN